ncbi:protein of unknown function DUF2493 [Geotalea daltonii FRC-32]|uniref:YspA cpYpsA-related SLOG domain-containing protein n=1 Tax=Geotalea daltonii (strain DSM 22248 / JCM 15807 / FRC-32) TaxID=316067 RepID=B9M108_GEODF|nr:DUF2493 domain-containing protein [Geotalea daltonii]ACM19078.1 protein of unknown function DUF2493 [Geotalea daltonii FRC-32]
MKVIVAGSRGITDYELIRTALDEARNRGLNITAIVDGMARGIDCLASRYATENGIDNIRVAADWKRYGKGAGILRNEQMAEIADALIAVWDGKSPGTLHMIECAKAKGLKNISIISVDKGIKTTTLLAGGNE